MKHVLATALAVAGFVLAQANVPSATYNGGIPMVPGTSVPESNPALDAPHTQRLAPSGPSIPSAGTGAAASSAPAPAGPAYSFGAAPAPLVSPAR
jgi:hypothetical protein